MPEARCTSLALGGVLGHLRSSVGLTLFFLRLSSYGAGFRWVVGFGLNRVAFNGKGDWIIGGFADVLYGIFSTVDSVAHRWVQGGLCRGERPKIHAWWMLRVDYQRWQAQSR